MNYDLEDSDPHSSEDLTSHWKQKAEKGKREKNAMVSHSFIKTIFEK